MKCNMGKVDRIIRSTAGIIFIAYALYTFDPIWIIPIVIITYTVATRWCILYQMLGINTGCHLEETSVKKGRGNILEGLSVSMVLLLSLFIIYLIIRYMMIE